MIRLICWLVFSSSFSCLLRFSRKSGLSRRQSVNSNGCKPAVTILTMCGSFRSSFFTLALFLFTRTVCQCVSVRECVPLRSLLTLFCYFSSAFASLNSRARYTRDTHSIANTSIYSHLVFFPRFTSTRKRDGERAKKYTLFTSHTVHIHVTSLRFVRFSSVLFLLIFYFLFLLF